MVVWTGDSSRTVGMTLAERNQRIIPAHSIGRPEIQFAARQLPRTQPAVDLQRPQVARRESHSDLKSLPGGSYRVVFGDGRVEWLTVIDRNGEQSTAPPVVTTTVRGERAHVIRVTERAMDEAAR